MIVLRHSKAEYGIIEAYKKPTRVRLTRRGYGRKQQLRSCDMPSISRTPSIYQIRHIESGKVYVGSAAEPRKRYAIHLTLLRKGRHHSRYLQNAWNKYGEDAFVFEIIEPVLFVEDLITREQYWIDGLRASERKYGFNVRLSARSNIGIKKTDEQRTAMSDITKAQFTDPEKRATASAAQRARYAKPEERVKASIQAKAQRADPEYRARQSALAKARYADPIYRANHAAGQKKRRVNRRAKLVDEGLV